MKKIVMLFIFGLIAIAQCRAEEITVVYSGEGRAALYPCHCPVQRDGGIARRLTKIKELRKADPDLLLLDSGDLFGGGTMDYASQNVELNMKRTSVYLSAVKLMGYDALGIGIDEFNFGKEFLAKEAKDPGLPFVSANIKIENVLAYIIKDIKGVKVAVIGLTTPQAKDKAPGVEFINPLDALKSSVTEVKNQGAEVIILLASFLLGEEEVLLKEVEGIDVLILPGSPNGKVEEKIGSTIVLHPTREVRRLGELKLTLKDGKITDYKAQEMRLSSDIKDDPQILQIMPCCFSSRDCEAGAGQMGRCSNPGELSAECIFSEMPKVTLTVISPKSCFTCNTEGQIEKLKNYFGNLEVVRVDYESSKGRKLVKEIGITALPLFLFTKEVEKHIIFNSFKDNLLQKGGYYAVKPEFIGVGYFSDRKRKKGQFDLFMSLFRDTSAELLERVRPYKPYIHFLLAENQESLTIVSPNGLPELEEDLRAVCVMENYPDQAFDYLICRSKNIQSTWWEDCAQDMDLEKIRTCAKGKEGIDLLRKNIELNKELMIGDGPTYLLGNQEIFSSLLNPSEEELKKIMDANK